MMSDARTVYAVGIDGVPPRVVERGIDSGKLANLATIRSEGASGLTRTTTPPLSMIAWSTFATGRDPGNHGIFNFMLETGTRDVEFATHGTLTRQSIPYWDYMDAMGIPTGVVNVMPGYPPSRSAGYHISDNVTTPPGGEFVHPGGLREDIEEAIGEYYIDPYEPAASRDADSLESYVESLFSIERDRIALAKHLIEAEDCRVHTVVFSGSDSILHNLGHLLDPDHPKYDAALADEFGDKPLQLLAEYDSFIGWLMDRLGPRDQLFVLSDHGHSPVHRQLNLNSWLYNQGYLELEDRPVTRAKAFAYNHLYETVEAVMKRLGVFSYVKNGVARTSDGDGGLDLADRLTISRKDIDWEGTDAYTIASGGQVFLNTDGRSEETVEQLVAALSAITDPATGEPVMHDVERDPASYQGEFGAQAPDIVCTPERPYQIQYPQVMKTKEVFDEPPKPWSHTSNADLDGVFFGWGDEVRPVEDARVDIRDFAPMFFYALDRPVPASMDGTVPDIFDSDRPAREAEFDGRVRAKRAVRTVVEGLDA